MLSRAREEIEYRRIGATGTDVSCLKQALWVQLLELGQGVVEDYVQAAEEVDQ
jgi:hypothetical protein